MADRSSSSRPPEGRETPPGAPGEGEPVEAPGLGEQFGRTRAALVGLIRSHIDLAKAEFGEIGGEIKRAAALGGAALLLLFLASAMIVLGSLLFVGETLFGSIGWGVLDGALLLIAVCVLMALAIVELSFTRAASALMVAALVGVAVTGLLVADWQSVSQHNSGLPAAWLLALVAGAAVLGLLGTLLLSSFGRGAALAGLIVGLVAGALIGALASAGPGPRVGSALGVAVGLVVWPIVAAVLVFRHGVDFEKLKARFLPMQTIETTKETIEWVREQLPLARKS